MSGLRERNKERRRGAILDAALELLRSNEIRTVTIEQIATRAEVSPPTVYNLIGTREQLLVALVDRVTEDWVERLEPTEEGTEDPIALARAGVERSAAGFVADSHAYRQIIRSLGDIEMPGSKLAFDPTQLQVRAMRRAQELGLVRKDLDPVALGRQIHLAYVGALFAWAGGGLSDRGFRTAALHGLATVLAAASTDAHREAALAELADLSPTLARANWNRR